ncbi:MAG: 4-keto-6-deoxy-N-Acetyl-D-hexosaminyl-(Lipid carrier) aminotransferase [uncultured Truepera sp.]|uniref:4-keto-6-deoxy-N-Acetyl-D-hexosaminyl-(Lipid carrier) aminotransferase n=1 Tax=uncultured Truepera sp. TaxID=543023 RepID=A0A6J4VTT4_9DEIN|nr:MAG: 4-keto-6-deoxy-N-Acetyl-D-hexosaminyl-(Lipid carrier) aminotransferase [uncultured Truepera sp.]
MSTSVQTSTRIYLSPPHLGDAERTFVAEAFDSNWIAPLGPNVDGFERDLQVYTGAAHAAALSSGTAALHLALILLGVKTGDEVVCSSFTFSASANPILYEGATPVFVDSEADTWNIDPGALSDALEDRQKKGKLPKAVIAVHLYGMPAKMVEIMDICGHYGVPLIEDAAEALGSTYHGKAMGTFGALGILSFNGNKIITTSGGGALISDDADWIQKSRFLATQARDPAPHYQHSQVGYNYRLSNVSAGIGRGQMQVLDDRVAARRANTERYSAFLAPYEGVTFQAEPDGMFSNRWLSTILVDPGRTGGVTREDLRLALDADNIEARPLWKPLHLQPIFAAYPYYGDGLSERLFDRGLCLPSGSNLSDEEFSRVTRVLKGVLEGRG